MPCQHLMIDLETMGCGPDAAIVQIGAIAFNQVGFNDAASFFTDVNLSSSVRAGGVMDPSTVLWWLDQSDAARLAITKPHTALDIATALRDFSAFYDQHCDHNTMVWGNGADFDPVILRSAYRRLGLLEPWGTFRVRCFRTLKALHPGIPYERPFRPHHALSDAKAQAEHLIKLPAVLG